MMRDLPPPTADETDAELSALFATLKDDRAPEDLEARLLRGLAAATAAGAGAAVAKATFWQKVAVWLGTSGLVKAMTIGAVCGGAFCTVITALDAPDRPQAPESGAVARPAGPSAAAPGKGKEGKGRGTDGSDQAAAPGEAAPARVEAPAPGRPDQGGAAVPAPSAPSPVVAAGRDGEAAGSGAPPEGSAGGGAGAPAARSWPVGASDALRRELLLVREIAALVEAGRCAEARAAIGAYRRENRAGQLAGEVDVLEGRCQGR